MRTAGQRRTSIRAEWGPSFLTSAAPMSTPGHRQFPIHGDRGRIRRTHGRLVTVRPTLHSPATTSAPIHARLCGASSKALRGGTQSDVACLWVGDRGRRLPNRGWRSRAREWRCGGLDHRARARRCRNDRLRCGRRWQRCLGGLSLSVERVLLVLVALAIAASGEARSQRSLSRGLTHQERPVGESRPGRLTLGRSLLVSLTASRGSRGSGSDWTLLRRTPFHQGLRPAIAVRGSSSVSRRAVASAQRARPDPTCGR